MRVIILLFLKVWFLVLLAVIHCDTQWFLAYKAREVAKASDEWLKHRHIFLWLLELYPKWQ